VCCKYTVGVCVFACMRVYVCLHVCVCICARLRVDKGAACTQSGCVCVCMYVCASEETRVLYVHNRCMCVCVRVCLGGDKGAVYTQPGCERDARSMSMWELGRLEALRVCLCVFVC